MKKTVFVAALGALVLAGCGSAPAKKDSEAALTDRQWINNAAVTTAPGKTTTAPSPLDDRLKNQITVVKTWREADGRHCAEIRAVKVESNRETYNRDGTVCAKPGEAYVYQAAKAPVPEPEKAKPPKKKAKPKK